MATMFDSDSGGENDFLGFDTSEFPTGYDWDFPTEIGSVRSVRF